MKKNIYYRIFQKEQHYTIYYIYIDLKTDTQAFKVG